jgi:hypothetical protein
LCIILFLPFPLSFLSFHCPFNLLWDCSWFVYHPLPPIPTHPPLPSPRHQLSNQ